MDNIHKKSIPHRPTFSLFHYSIFKEITMDFERYYLDLFEILTASCKKIASGKFEPSDSEKLFELSKKGRYPSFLADLAEAFGMMLVKFEAREFQLNETIEDLETAKAKLEEYSQKLERELEECLENNAKTDAE
jgi:hypothetical protein